MEGVRISHFWIPWIVSSAEVRECLFATLETRCQLLTLICAKDSNPTLGRQQIPCIVPWCGDPGWFLSTKSMLAWFAFAWW